ncbi:MAG: histidinol dehydrogenase [Campylobacteraceae bacterium]|jgi:histidinol dehydrogenase|nr:histidinol dehydrogenase [Campylobacteraceae bacterium]
MKILRTTDKNFNDEFNTLLLRGAMDLKEAGKIVESLLDEIKAEKNEALKRHILKFDKWEAKSNSELEISPSLMEKAYENLSRDLKDALHRAYKRIFAFHEKQLPKSWLTYEDNGIVLGQKISAVDKAGLYIPGGKAAYPSSLLMNAIPAIVAGVKEIVVCTPAPNNELNQLLLAAMYLCGVKKAFKIGGASAIGAMAYGTENIPKVDVITGPGNIFVATAKKMVFGDVNIDMIAGPSEIGILADKNANAKYLAIDLLSQAEHDEMASSILITTDEEIAKNTLKEIELYLPKLSRQAIASVSMRTRSAIIVAKELEEAIFLMNKIAPEHLEIVTKNPFDLLPKIKHAGAIFMGSFTPEPIGDYIAGPNHTLPTGGTARFFSPLNVEHFMKKSSIISMSKDGMREIGESCANLANAEGLSAHEESVRVRLRDLK